MRSERVLRFAVVILVCAAIGIGLTFADCLKCKIKGFVGAHGRQDLDKVMSYLADDFRCQDLASEFEVDRDGFRQLLEWDFATGTKLIYEDLQWEGDTVTAVFVEAGSLYELAGLEPRRYRVVFRFEDNLIREQTFEALPSDGPSVAQALEPVLAWASDAHPAETANVFRDGEFVFDGTAGETWMALLEEWNETR